jgi:Adenylate and Guanylate cyclase catalytic domain
MAESSAAADGLERKLATILSADVAAYSRLMAEDEERTLQTFRAHKEVFEKLVELHRGRVFNTAGDAILAEFSSAVEAVRCATEIQAALRTRNDQLARERQVNFRIGVNLGDVMVQGADLLETFFSNPLIKWQRAAHNELCDRRNGPHWWPRCGPRRQRSAPRSRLGGALPGRRLGYYGARQRLGSLCAADRTPAGADIDLVQDLGRLPELGEP